MGDFFHLNFLLSIRPIAWGFLVFEILCLIASVHVIRHRVYSTVSALFLLLWILSKFLGNPPPWQAELLLSFLALFVIGRVGLMTSTPFEVVCLTTIWLAELLIFAVVVSPVLYPENVIKVNVDRIFALQHFALFGGIMVAFVGSSRLFARRS